MRPIIVPVDFSEYSTVAFQYACILARQMGGRVDLVHVRSERGGEFPEPHVQVCDPEVTIEYVVLHGLDVATELLAYLHRSNSQLVVMGTHGRTGLSHFFLGSVAEKMIRHAPVPVITLHKDAPLRKIGRILTAVDFSEASAEALRYAADFSAKINAEMEVLHVIERVMVPVAYPEGVIPMRMDTPEIQQKIMTRLRQFCGEFAPRMVHRHLASGLPWEEIIKTADERDVDLIAMGTRGLSGFPQLLVGSTAERVARYSHRAVLTVRKVVE